IVAMIMGYALAEMVSAYPVAGSFGVYADKYVGPWAGFTVRLTYWFAQTVAIGAEVTAVGLYFGYWLPSVPSWVWIMGSSALVLAVKGLEWTMPLFAVWLAVTTLFYFLRVRASLVERSTATKQ